MAADGTPTAWLWAILALSLALNLWGNWFGLPDAWHPDESVGRAVRMARNLTLNPHSFLYGSFHYYLVLMVIVPTYFATKLLSLPEEAQKTAVYLAARGLTAVLGAGCVALTYLLARRLFDRTTALLAALLLALSVGLVNIAHFATVDAPMLFWMMASYLMSARVMSRGGLRESLSAGAFAGLAAGTKYVGGVAAVTLVAAHVLSQGNRTIKHLLWGIVAAAVAFVVVDLPILFASCEFLEGFIIDNAYNTTIGASPDAIPGVQVAGAILDSLELPVCLLVVAALFYFSILTFRRKHLRQTGFLMSTVVPFYLLISNVHYASIRHVLPIVPPLLIMVGKMLCDLRGGWPAGWWRRRFADALVAAVVVVSGVYVLSTELQFTFDGRNLAAHWIIEHAAPGTKIEVTHYPPRFPDDRYVVVERPWLRNLDAEIAGLKNAPLYRTLQPLYLAYKSFAEPLGLCTPRERHYTGWYEAAEADSTTALVTFDPTIEGLNARAPDLFVVSSLYYDRFDDDPTGPDGRFFARLFAGETSYHQVAEFHYEFMPWLDPLLEFINPTVRIFQRPHDSRADRSG